MNIIDKFAMRRIEKRGINFKSLGLPISFDEWSKKFITTPNTPIQEIIEETIAKEFAKIDLFAYEEKQKTNDGSPVYNDLGDFVYEYDELKGTNINNILQVRPNPLLSAYEWKYIVAYQMCKYGNSLTEIIWKSKETYEIEALHPLDMERYEFGSGYQLKNGRIFMKLRDRQTGQLKLLNYEDFIHVRSNPNAIFSGDKNHCLNSINSLVKLFDANLNATLNELVDSGEIAGVLELGTSSTGTLDNALMGNPEKKNKEVEVVDRIKSANGRILVIDAGEKFTQLSSPFKTMDSEKMEEWMNYIYTFKGVNEAVINGTASEDDMEVFFNKSIVSIIEPFIEEINYKCLSQNIRTRGRVIDYRRNPFEYVSVTKAMDSAYKGAMFLTKNEGRKMIFKLPPKPGGDVLVDNLNFTPVTEEGGNSGKNT